MWVKADWEEPWEKRSPFVLAAIEAGADAVVIRPDDSQEALKLGAISFAANEPTEAVNAVVLSVRNVKDLEEAIERTRKLREKGKRVAVLVEISSKELERAAVRAGEVADFLIATTTDWKIIPLENLIAELQHAGVKVLAGVKDAEEAKTAVETLEVGAAGVLLDPREKGIGEIQRVFKTFDQLAEEKLKLTAVKITAVHPVGSGDRVCVDTMSLVTLGEGMLVGSQAGGMFLVHSETLPSEFVEPRPFRANAGAVHAYIRLPGGKTKHMSQLSAGDEVLIVDTKGEARAAVAGRVKIERRPFLLVEAEHEGGKFKILLQNAETINLVARDGKPISVTKLRPDDEVLMHIERAGRHFGIKVGETVVER